MPACLLSLVVLAVWPAPAAAKGPRTHYYLPGERWTYQSDWGFGSVSAAREGEKRDWVAYFVRRGGEVTEGKVIAHVRVWHLLPQDRWLRFRVAFRIPDVPGGVYRVVICSVGCTQSFGTHPLVRRVIVLEGSERFILNKLRRSIVAASRDWFWRLEDEHDLIEAVELEQTISEVKLKGLKEEIAELKLALAAEQDGDEGLGWWFGLAGLVPVAGLVLWRRRNAPAGP